MIEQGRKVLAAFCGGFFLSTGALAAEPELVWQADGFDGPESALLDPEAGELYVSNVNGKPGDKDGNGYISRLSLEGEVLDRQWRTGLDGPKGLALHDGKLYVSDITRLVVIDTANGEIIATYEAPGAKYLNDVTAHEDGRIFVSDMMTNQIWQLDGDQFSVWLEDEALQNPNGLLAEPDRLLVASWGSTEVPGHLKAVDYQSKSIETVGEDQPVGHLDGLEPDGKGGYLVTDWLNGGLYKFDEHGPAALLMDLDKGSADLEFVVAENLAVIPMMMDGTVVAYNLP